MPWKLWGPCYTLLFGERKDLHKFRKSRTGKRTYIDPSVRILGWENVVIGDNTVLSEDVWLNINHRKEGHTRIIIGNNCHIGIRNFFSSGPLISIKDYCFTGIDCHFLGCGHIIESPFVPYIASGLTEGAKIEIGVNCWLTTSVTVHQGVSIGHGSIIGARSVVHESIPPFSIAVGNPCKVIKRFDLEKMKWIDAKNWTDGQESMIPTENEYKEILKEEYQDISPAIISTGKRFGWL